MAFVVKDRVKVTTTTTGTGTLTLGSAVSGYRAFSDIGNANTTCYVILEASESAPTAWEVGIGTYTSSGTTLSRDTVLQTSAGNTTKITLAAGTHTVICGWSADFGLGAEFAQHAITPGGRLTLTSGTPVTTSDVTAATSIYYAPYLSNVITLWTGARWQPIEFTEYTLALGTLTSGKPYDVFAYLSSGVLALEMLAWTNDTTRATAITIQDGRYCKSGDKTRLYLGTFYTTATTTTEDSAANRYVANFYNSVKKSLSGSSSASHTYSTAAYQEWNNGTSVTRAKFLLVRPQSLLVNGSAYLTKSVPGGLGNVTLAYDSTTSNQFGAGIYSNWGGTNNPDATTVTYGVVLLAEGAHYITMQEYGFTNQTYSNFDLRTVIEC